MVGERTIVFGLLKVRNKNMHIIQSSKHDIELVGRFKSIFFLLSISNSLLYKWIVKHVVCRLNFPTDVVIWLNLQNPGATLRNSIQNSQKWLSLTLFYQYSTCLPLIFHNSSFLIGIVGRGFVAARQKGRGQVVTEASSCGTNPRVPSALLGQPTGQLIEKPELAAGSPTHQTHKADLEPKRKLPSADHKCGPR